MAWLGFFLAPMTQPGIELMSVQLHLFWGTLIQGASPTELLQPVVRIPVPGHGVHILPLQRVLDDELVELLDLVAGCEGPRKTRSEFNIHWPESFNK